MIASPLVCLKIDVIFVILSTLLPYRPRVSRASAPGHLFLHAYKLTSTLLHTATPSSVDEYPESETREVADENGRYFFRRFFHRRLLRALFFSKRNVSEGRYCSLQTRNGKWIGIEREFEYYCIFKFVDCASEDLHQAL